MVSLNDSIQPATIEVPDARVGTGDWFGTFPCDSGYYWVDRWDCIRIPFICYVKADDPDSGTRRVNLMDGRWVNADDPKLAEALWFGPLQEPSLPNAAVSNAEPKP